MTWRCRADWMVPPRACDTHGDKDSQAEKHTQTSGHPTESWPFRPDLPLLRIKTTKPAHVAGSSISGEQ